MDEVINYINDAFNKELNDKLMQFLRSKGYRPRNTVTYANNLKKKLEKQGLELVVNIYTRNDMSLLNDSTGCCIKREYNFMIRPIKKED